MLAGPFGSGPFLAVLLPILRFSAFAPTLTKSLGLFCVSPSLLFYPVLLSSLALLYLEVRARCDLSPHLGSPLPVPLRVNSDSDAGIKVNPRGRNFFVPDPGRPLSATQRRSGTAPGGRRTNHFYSVSTNPFRLFLPPITDLLFRLWFFFIFSVRTTSF